ncbi:MAG TPA: hypothetical protein VHM01_06850 [Alphaproteobacteria bacterium]|nr:hypothetical protein [Alphaproteobacteria bacterium]
MSSAHAADDLAAQRAGVEQLIRSQLPTGLLEFDMDFFAGTGLGSGITSREKSAFIARQAGTAYGIAKYYEQTKDERVRQPLAKFIEALGALSLPVGKSTAQRAVESIGTLSLPFLRARLRNTLDELGLLYVPSGDGALVAYEQGYAAAWAGTTALALLAELHYFRAAGDARFAPLRERWRNGLGALRIPGGGFREYPASLDESPYANGEAWLAFTVFAETFPNGSVSAEEIRSLDDHMIATYGDEYNNGFFHWGAMAAVRRFLASRDRRFVEFAERQARLALANGPPADSPANTCGLVEGLAASAATLARADRRDDALLHALRVRIRAEMDKNNALQLRPGQDRIAAGADSYLLAPRLGTYAGAYLLGRHTPTIRIDMTQHCISAIAEMQAK